MLEYMNLTMINLINSCERKTKIYIHVMDNDVGQLRGYKEICGCGLGMKLLFPMLLLQKI